MKKALVIILFFTLIAISITGLLINKKNNEISLNRIDNKKIDNVANEKINNDIKNRIIEKLDSIDDTLNIETNYNVYGNFANVLFISYRIYNKENYHTISGLDFNYELLNGNRLNFEDLFKIDADIYSIVRRIYNRRLVNSIAADFLCVAKEDLKFEYTKTRTSEVYKNLVDGKVDVIFVVEPSEDDLEYAKSKEIDIEIIPTPSSAFVFSVNSENPVENLTLDEIIKMISVNGVNPTIETIKDGTYPIYTNGYIVIRKDAQENSNVRK